MCSAARALEEGSGGVAKDVAGAVELYERCVAEEDNYDAMYRLGDIQAWGGWSG